LPLLQWAQQSCCCCCCCCCGGSWQLTARSCRSPFCPSRRTLSYILLGRVLLPRVHRSQSVSVLCPRRRTLS
jgi:hypothetical protein